MRSNKTFVTFISHTPFCEKFCEEGLRFALGSGNSMIKHTITAVFICDGVWFAHNNLEQRDFEKYIKAFRSMDMDLIVEKESLEERKISLDNIKKDFKVMERVAIYDILKNCNFSVSF